MITLAFSFSSEALSQNVKMEYRCKKVAATGERGFYRFFDLKLTSDGFYGEVKFFSKRRNKFFIQTFTGTTQQLTGYFQINSRILLENRKPLSKQGFINFDKSSRKNVNITNYLQKGIMATQGARFCNLKLLQEKNKNQKLVKEESKKNGLASLNLGFGFDAKLVEFNPEDHFFQTASLQLECPKKKNSTYKNGGATWTSTLNAFYNSNYIWAHKSTRGGLSLFIGFRGNNNKNFQIEGIRNRKNENQKFSTHLKTTNEVRDIFFENGIPRDVEILNEEIRVCRLKWDESGTSNYEVKSNEMTQENLKKTINILKSFDTVQSNIINKLSENGFKLKAKFNLAESLSFLSVEKTKLIEEQKLKDDKARKIKKEAVLKKQQQAKLIEKQKLKDDKARKIKKEAVLKKQKLIISAQKSLKKLDLFQGKISGKLDKKSLIAFDKWLKNNNYKQTRLIDDVIVLKLKKSAETYLIQKKAVLETRRLEKLKAKRNEINVKRLADAERKRKDDEAIKLIETKRKEMETRLAAIKAKRDKKNKENAILLAEEERKFKEAKIAADKAEQTRKDEERRLAEAILKVEEAERKAEEDDQKRKEDKARRLKEAADIEKQQQEAKLENERKVKAEQNKKLFSELETKGKSYIKDAQIFIQDNLTSPNMLPISMAALELKKAINSNNGMILKKAIRTFEKKMRKFSDFYEYRRLLIEKRKQKEQDLAKKEAEAKANKLAEEAKIEAEAISNIKAIFTSYKEKLVKLLSISLSVNSSVSEKLIPIIQQIDNGIKSNDKAKLESSLNNIKKLIKSNNEINKYINGEPKKIKKSKNIPKNIPKNTPKKTNVSLNINETFFCISTMNMKELYEITKMWASFNKRSEQENLYKTMALPGTLCTFYKVDRITKLETEEKVSTSKDGIVTYSKKESRKYTKTGKLYNYVHFYRQVKSSKISSNISNNKTIKKATKKAKKERNKPVKENKMVKSIYACNSKLGMDMAYQIASSMWVYADDNNFVDMFNRINKSYNGNAKCFLENGKATRLDKEIKGYTTQKGTNIYYERNTSFKAIYVSKQVKSSYSTYSTLSGDLKKAGECKAIVQYLTMYYQIVLKDKANENKYFNKSAVIGKQLKDKYSQHSQQWSTLIKHIDNYSTLLTKVYKEGSAGFAPWLKNKYEQKGCTIYGNIR